jgi:hypothetical protein
VFIPQIPETGKYQVWCWPDTDRKKHHVYKEYQEQLVSGADLNNDKKYPLIVGVGES